LEKYNLQYNPIEIKKFNSSHDRFLIIDEKQVYHFGASLKDVGKKWFAFSKFDMEAIAILEKLDK
ncbi:MAG: ORF6N domain-containing protein, partial [Arcobacter sp.]|nr:ORF6N domain-containing protein [Arcobacter sp.]